jgi:hypothetical protein
MRRTDLLRRIVLCVVVAVVGAAAATFSITDAAYAAGFAPRSQPTAITDPAGHMFVIVTDNANGHILFTRHDTDTSGFTAWTDIQGVNAGNTVAATLDSQGLVILFVRGTTNKIYYNPENNDGSRTFTGWQPVPGGTTFTSDPVATNNQANDLEVFAANGNTVYHIWQSSPTGPFVSSWSSLGTVPVSMNPGSGKDMSVALSAGHEVVLTAGRNYRVSVNGSWGAWQRTTFDHISLQTSGNNLNAVGPDYFCNLNCTLYAAWFSDAQHQFQGAYRPEGSPTPIYLGPPATGAYDLGLDVAINNGVDIFYTPTGGCTNCGPGWWDLGQAPQQFTTEPALGEMEAYQLTFVLVSTSNGVAYQIIYRDSGTPAPSGGWVQI